MTVHTIVKHKHTCVCGHGEYAHVNITTWRTGACHMPLIRNGKPKKYSNGDNVICNCITYREAS